MNESSADPGRLQATFVPALATLAWWGVADLESALSALGLPSGTASTCRLAVPADGTTVAPRTVGVRTADLTDVLPALRRMDAGPDEVGASVWAWHRAALQLDESDDTTAWTELAGSMPTAAHAWLRADETAIGTAASTLRQFAAAAGTGSELAAADIRATLRPYQIHGVTWLRALAGEGGGILADEMGLGKTLQAISLLATRAGSGPHLVVCPTSVIGNWRRELGRFAPDLPVLVHHGASRGLPATVPDATVVLTSYSVLRTDADALTARAWDCVVFDEAQQIKNPTALAAKAAARLPATLKVAMTGTPVENRLEELWSLFHVTNPAVLGTRARFRQRFATPIESGRSRTAAVRLAAVIEPYVLRRTKSQVATELPPKQFSTVACTLTDEQTRLYRAAVADAFASGLGSGIARRGNVLALLTTLKQVCNHPAQVGAGGDDGLIGRSGKFDRATEMLAEIVADGDRALVFTQYRGMGELLSSHLTAELGVGTIPFLHGGLSVERRDRLVDDFQTGPDAAPVLILSLRAAGFGLNLTRASHVLHYDRWWNPAVEAQATDRAHRIGQQQTVNVHTLVTGGTIEDHIAAMHESKRALAESVTGNTEAALADLPDTELRALLDLDAIGVC
ncbi:DEAD/DEAH box helicase [Rhodococcus kronopolitis]|uniref:DEAD/DEAH box helicase n=1 Tax=Rhodococcus kronopolitis TaxID=1460226 RepID=A0ABV9FVT0_9NOCA